MQEHKPHDMEFSFKNKVSSPAPLARYPYQLYEITEVETKLIQRELRRTYKHLGVVKFKADEDREPGDEEAVVQLFAGKGSRLPIIEIKPSEWCEKIVAPDATHFWGPCKAVDISALFGLHLFLWEFLEPDIWTFDKEMALRALEHTISKNSAYWVHDELEWAGYSQFRLLIFRLIELGSSLSLLDVLKRRQSDKFDNMRHEIERAMLHIYISGLNLGVYAATQHDYETLLAASGLKLRFTIAERIELLKELSNIDGAHPCINKALDAIEVLLSSSDKR